MFCVFQDVSDSEILDPSMEEQGDVSVASISEGEASESEGEPSDSEGEASDSEEEPGSEQCGTTNPHSLNQKTSGGM